MSKKNNVVVGGFAAFVALSAAWQGAAEEIVFKPTEASYRYEAMNESSNKRWWVDEKYLDLYLGSNVVPNVTFYGEQDKSIYSNLFKRVISNWPRNVGKVKGDNTWLWEFRVPHDAVDGLAIADARDFFGWWRFLRASFVNFTSASADYTPVMQRVECIGRAKMNVPAADGKVIVSNLFGAGVIQKIGAGEMEVVRTGGAYVNIDHHAGTLTLHEQEKGASTTFEAVLAKAKVHFDASDTSKFEFDANGKISKWHASAPNTQYYADQITTNKYNMGAPMFTDKYKAERLPLPVYRANYSATGLGVVDFGPYRTYDAADVDTCGASALSFFSARVNFSEAFIVFADNDPQCRCPVFCDSHNVTFPRGSSYLTFDSVNLMNFNGGVVSVYNSASRVGRDVRVNGRLVPAGFPLAGSNLKVVSIDCIKKGNVQASESVMGSFGRGSSTTLGGQVVAEYIGFTVSLTDAERQAVNRYLMRKWLGTADCDDAAVNTVQLDAGTQVSVPAGETAVVNHLLVTTNAATIVKKGGGTLGVVDTLAYAGAGSDGISLDVQEGAVAVKAPAQALSDNPTFAASPRYHFDASDLTTILTDVVDNVTCVTQWNDVAQADVYAYPVRDEVGLKAMTNGTATLPAKPTLIMNELNGLPVVSLGTRVDQGVIKASGYGTSAAFIYTKRSDDNVSTYANVFEGFIVYRSIFCPYIFSSTASNSLRPLYSDGWHLIKDRYGQPAMKSGVWTVNGEQIDPATFMSTNYRGQNFDQKYLVVRFSANDRVHVDGVGFETLSPTGLGGIRIGEIVLYDRRLNEMERRDTEAYLMKKWLNKTHPYANGPQISKLTLGQNAASQFETDVDITVANIETKATTFTKAGSGTLTADLPDGVTDLTVAAGGYDLEPMVSNVMAKALIHLDATVASSLVYEDGETKAVSQWCDVRGTDYPKAVHDANYYEFAPLCVANAQNNLPVIDFGDTTTTNPKENPYTNFPNPGKALCFDRDLYVREGYLVMKHTDYASILGGKTDNAFHPDWTKLIDVSTSYDYSLSCLKRASEWRVDEDEIDIWAYTWSTYKSAGTGYHVLSFAITNDYTSAVSGKNCAHVSTLCGERAVRAGGQKYGEIVLFDRALQPVEREALRTHLIRKWNTAETATPALRTLDRLTLGAGATVSLGSVVRSVGSVESAGGTIAGDLTLSENAALLATYRSASDYSQTVVTGTLALPAAATCTLTMDTATKPSPNASIDLYVADEITGSCAAWRNVVVQDTAGRPYGPRLALLSVVTRDDGKKVLRATFFCRGFQIIMQ